MGDATLTESIIRIWKESLREILSHEELRSDPGKHQVVIRSVATASTRIEALRSLSAYVSVCGKGVSFIESAEAAFVSETLDMISRELCIVGYASDANESFRALTREPGYVDSFARVDVYSSIGEELIQAQAANDRPISTARGDDSDERELRSSTRKFAQEIVAPLAEGIHRNNLLVPEEVIRRMAELGYFGLSIPEAYGGVGMNNLMMVIATEELSAASLGAAGSLMTRPEILSKALLKGGTDAQQAQWLPRIASGESMIAVAVTEPNTGSDVGSVACRATSADLNGESGYLLNGAKAWCTFAGRANILALLARTDENPSSGHKGLSLFIVEKDIFEGHEFVIEQPCGGRLTAKADSTLGYRGMHSFTLQFDDYFVPASNLVGEESGTGRGFYLQMDGFAAGRLQTGGRAVGLAQAALEATISYVKGRPQFGSPISEYQNTHYELGRMAVSLEAARQLTYIAAQAMDAHAENASTLAAMAKLFSCRVAVETTQRGQLLHGGWGYAEEYPISRYVVDALVLPIFEGVEPILEMKVIGRAILSEG